MRVALDTNRYTDFMRGEATIAEQLESAEEVIIPAIVLGELRAGFLLGSKGAANEKYLEEFLQLPKVRVAGVDADTTRHYAAVVQQTVRAGRKIPMNDAWIAALAIQHDLALCTRDRHFEHIPQLKRI